MSKPLCAVRGLVAPGAMCGKHIAGGKCGFAGECEHQREPAPERQKRTCIACGARHPFNPDGTPVGGALPCGH